MTVRDGRDRLPLFRVLDLVCRNPDSPWTGVERMVATVIVNHGSPATVSVDTIVRESGFCERAVKKALRSLTATGKRGSPPLFDVVQISRRKARTYTLRESADRHRLQRVPIYTVSGYRVDADRSLRVGADMHSERVLIGSLHKRTEAPLEALTEKRSVGSGLDEARARDEEPPLDTSRGNGDAALTGTADAERLKGSGVSDADAAAVTAAAVLFDGEVGDVRSDELDPVKAWEAAKAKLSLGVNVIATWFRPTRGVAVEDGTLTVAVPNPEAKRWLLHNYQGAIRSAMDEAGFGSLKVALAVRVPQPDAAPIARLAGKL